VVAGSAPPLLTTLPRKAELLVRSGSDRVYVRKFDASFAAWEPERFVRDLVVAQLRAKVVSVGENFRFGSKRKGDLALMRSLGEELGFEARVHAIAKDASGPYSSTRARMCIAAGDLAAAEHVLGRRHALSGTVAHGQKLGRTLGFPTANLDDVREMLPADGIYAVLVDRLEDGDTEARALAKGVMSIGVRPTLGGDLARTVEAFLFDFDAELYGARLRVHLVSRLREERRFPGLDELKVQMKKDEEEARAAVASIAANEGAFG
jgi:riboflavin kinase/FMN adenylyltransferase